MSFSMAPLLIHSADVPPAARRALLAASATQADARRAHLVSAARILYAEVGLACAEACELVGLVDDESCT